MNNSPKYNQQQTKAKQCKSEVEELCALFTNTWKLAIAESISEKNTNIVGSMLERNSLKKLYRELMK